MHATTTLQARQLWNLQTSRPSSSTSHCHPITLYSDGVLSFGTANVITLTTNIVYQPQCTDTTVVNAHSGGATASDPFYASQTPQIYVISAATVLAWVLMVMLTISPRAYYGGGIVRASPFLGGRGVISGGNGGSGSLIGVGSRPWLQKAAALTVAIALTIATAEAFKTTEAHYPAGIDGDSLRQEVENSLQIRITRVVSDIFVYLAQVQTLIRLFPRHKEKVLIKWIGFALIVLDTTFGCLNSFWSSSPRRPRDYVDAIPALSYLFELALGLLYAAWVLYYVATKIRYAFYHPRMKNIGVIALLSLVSILTPVVFFVTDVTLPDVAGWGDYFRWVGAAAASVVVWEWVERIEALEKDEKKDGILGREIFDGDEMLDTNPSEQMTYVPSRGDRYQPRNRDGRDGDSGSSNKQSEKLSFAAMARRLPGTKFRRAQASRAKDDSASETRDNVTSQKVIRFDQQPHPNDVSLVSVPVTPPPVTSPPSRADTQSAASTVYVIRHNGIPEAPEPVRRRLGTTPEPKHAVQRQVPIPTQDNAGGHDDDKQAIRQRHSSQWQAVRNPFKRKRATPPAEVKAAMTASQEAHSPVVTDESGVGHSTSLAKQSPWGVKGRLGALCTGYDRRTRSAAKGPEVELPWTVIPAPARGAAAWSPDLATTGTLERNMPSGVNTPTRSDHANGSSPGQQVIAFSSISHAGSGTAQDDSRSAARSTAPSSDAAHDHHLPRNEPSRSTNSADLGDETKPD